MTLYTLADLATTQIDTLKDPEVNRIKNAPLGVIFVEKVSLVCVTFYGLLKKKHTEK